MTTQRYYIMSSVFTTNDADSDDRFFAIDPERPYMDDEDPDDADQAELENQMAERGD